MPSHNRTIFDYLLAIPLAIYLVIISGLLVGVFITIRYQDVVTAFSDPALLNSIKLSLITSAASAVLSVFVAIPAGYV
ncbi:MAG: hypothetical protein KAH23_09680, partial [Kiritimatiellae bacterium]|nr:hypothetical protein [Kiritimatiellia bacterium]